MTTASTQLFHQSLIRIWIRFLNTQPIALLRVDRIDETSRQYPVASIPFEKFTLTGSCYIHADSAEFGRWFDYANCFLQLGVESFGRRVGNRRYDDQVVIQQWLWQLNTAWLNQVTFVTRSGIVSHWFPGSLSFFSINPRPFSIRNAFRFLVV